MTPETFIEQFETLAEAPNGIEKLRELILQLAVQGKLGTHDENDEPASELFDRVRTARIPTSRAAKRSVQKPLPPIDNDEEAANLSNGWRWSRLGDLADWATGSGFPTSAQGHADKPYLFIKVSDMNLPGNEKFIVSAVNTIDDSIANEVGARLHPAGTVVFPKIGGAIATNKRRILTRPTAIDNNCLGLTPFGLCDPDWLYVLLTSIDFAKYQSGTSVPALSQGTLELLVIGLPPLAEQRRIVGKVDQLLGLCDELAARQAARREARSALVKATLDRLVSAADQTSRHPACRGGSSASALPESSAIGSAEAREPRGQAQWRLLQAERLRAHFDRLFDTPTTIPQLRQAILQLAVQGQLVPQDPNDEPIQELAGVADRRRGKWTGPIGEKEVPFSLPSTWIWLRLGDIATLKHGYAFSSRFFTNEPAPFVLTTPGNFYETGGFRDRESKRKYYSGPVDSEFILNPGDFIIPMTEQAAGLLGSPAFIPNDGRVYIHNQRLGKLTFSKLIAPEFAFWFFNSQFFRGELARTCTGMKVRHTSPDRILRVLTPVPPLAEQKRIVSKVSELLSLCDALEAKLTQTEAACSQLLSAAVADLLKQDSREATKARREQAT